MNGPEVAPTYPKVFFPPATITLQVNVIEETHWIHKEFEDVSAHYYLMVMDLSCLQIGTRIPDADEDLLLHPAIFQTRKGFEIQTGKFGTIHFPQDFYKVGVL